jgi:hypothetical protein
LGDKVTEVNMPASLRDYNLYGYIGDDGLTHEIRIDQFTAGAQGITPGLISPTNLPTSAQGATVGGSRRRRNKLFARGYRLYRDTAPGPTGKRVYSFIPVLNPAGFGAAPGISKGDQVILDGTTWFVGDKVAEVVRGA